MKVLRSQSRSLVICALAGQVLWAQSGATPGTAKRESTVPDPANVPYTLKTTGFKEEAFFQSLRKGEFQHIYVKPSDMRFREAYREFVRDYGKACRAELPPDAVELTEQECTKPNTVTRRDPITGNVFTENGNGCSEYVTRRTGIYADPKFAKNYYLSPQQAIAAVQGSLGMIGNPGQALSMAQTIAAVTSDVHQLFEMNSCSGPDMKILGENFRRFAAGEASLQSIPRESPDDPVYDVQHMTLEDYQKIFEFSGMRREQDYQNGPVREYLWTYKVSEGGPCRVRVDETRVTHQANNPAPEVRGYIFDFTKGEVDLGSLHSDVPPRLTFNTIRRGYATDHMYHFEGDPAATTRVRNLAAFLRSAVASCVAK